MSIKEILEIMTKMLKPEVLVDFLKEILEIIPGTKNA